MADDRSRQILFAAAATAGVGGQGLNLKHVVEAVAHGRDAHVYCRAPFPGVATTVIAPSPIDRVLPKIPVVRRLRDFGALSSEAAFDANVALRLGLLPKATKGREPIFHGAAGQCAWTMSRARRSGLRTMLDVVNTHVDDLKYWVDRECKSFGVRGFVHPATRARTLAEYADAEVIRVMSRRARETFGERGFDVSRVYVATPPVDFSEFEPATFSEPVFRIAFVGLIEPWKGFHYLVEAFGALAENDAELVLWGGPGSRPVTTYLREKVARDPRIKVRPESVRLTGYANVYSKSSVLVHPSLTDGFGYVVAEAMASGIPVIVCKNAGAADLVRDGENGFIVPPADASAIEERLRFLQRNPAQLHKLGAAARETARALTPEAFRDAYAPMLKQLE